MFKRFKAWLRGIIAEEVAKVSVSLTQEREEALVTIKNVENETACSFAKEVERIKATLEAEHEAFVIRLRATRNHVADGEPSRCHASPEQVAADHALRKTK